MIFKRLVYILITVLVLFADGGQTIYAHTCLKTHRTALAFNNQSCCHKKQSPLSGPVFKKPSCCVINATMVKHGVPGQIPTVEKVKLSTPIISAPGLLIAFISLPVIIISNGRSSSPEPLNTADILLTRVFRC